MKEFLNRLKYLGYWILAIIIVAVVIFGVGYLLSIIPHMDIIISILMFSIFGIAVIVQVVKFINWLFIEPFRKGRK